MPDLLNTNVQLIIKKKNSEIRKSDGTNVTKT